MYTMKMNATEIMFVEVDEEQTKRVISNCKDVADSQAQLRI